MIRDYLFPRSFRPIGWLLAIPCAILGFISLSSGYEPALLGAYTDEFATLGLIAGLIFIGFSRQKIEDEMIRKLRLESLQWSLYINYALLAVAVFIFYDIQFFQVLVYNMFTVLIVFIVRFSWLLYRTNTKEA